MKLKQIHKNFELYSRALVASKDVDPVYYILSRIIKHYDFEAEWFCFAYQGFYNIESGIKFCKAMPTRKHWNKKKFGKMRENGELIKFGTERRGTQRRVDNQIKMFESVVNWIDNWEKLIHESDLHGADPTDANGFRKSIEDMPNFSTWSSYKMCEIFEKTLGHKFLELPDLGLEDKNFKRNDGPLGGLRWLFDKTRGDETPFDFSKNKQNWLNVFNEFGNRLGEAWGIDLGEVETCLCKYHKLHTGKYWVGHDIAEFIHLRDYLGKKIFKKLLKDDFDKDLFDLAVFPTKLKKVYRDDNEILNNHYAEKYPEINTYKIMKGVLKDFKTKLPK